MIPRLGEQWQSYYLVEKKFMSKGELYLKTPYWQIQEKCRWPPSSLRSGLRVLKDLYVNSEVCIVLHQQNRPSTPSGGDTLLIICHLYRSKYQLLKA